MTKISRAVRRKRAVAITVAGATAFGGAALLTPGTSSASSHRESPYLITDPAIDGTDVYAFTSPDKADTVTLVANFSPVQEPAGGPNFFPFATDARYNINVDNNHDGKPDVIYRWTFKDIDRRGTVEHGDRGKGSILYNDGPVTTLDDPNLLFRQTYDLQVITNASSTAATTTLLRDVPVPPNNVGKASIPDYVPLREAAVAAGRAPNGVSAFAGQRDDPFFLDIRIFDLLYGGDLSERGFNSLAGKNVNTLAVQVPKALVAGSGNVNANPVIGVYSTSERQQTRVFKPTNTLPATSVSRSSDQVDSSGDWVQLSRLGIPLANEALIPSNLKDYFNRSTPDRDAQVPAVVAKVQDPEIPYLIEQIYKIPNPNKTAMGVNRPDLFATFLTGISKKSFPSAGIDLNASDLNANNAGVPSEMLRLNLTTPLTAQPNRLGVVGGDVGGFPNGRRLTDDVTDVDLQVLEGILIADQDAVTKRAVAGLGDNVNFNDKAFLPSFPYVADPHSGSDTPPGAPSNPPSPVPSPNLSSAVSPAPTASGSTSPRPTASATSSVSPSASPSASASTSPRPTTSASPSTTAAPTATPTSTPTVRPTVAPGTAQVTIRQNRNGRVTIVIRINNQAAAGGRAQIYLVNGNGSRTSLGAVRLDDSGTGTMRTVIASRAGARLTFNARVFAPSYSKARLGSSTLTVR